MRHQIFISHESDSTREFAEKICDWFENENNIKCWCAPRDLDQSETDEDFDDAIIDAIRECRCVIVLLNDSALDSKWVKREVTQAEKQGKKIIPYVISKLTKDNGLLMRLADKHLIESFPDPERKLSILLNKIKRILGDDVSNLDTDEETKTPSTYNSGFDLDFDEGLAFLEVGEDRDAFYSLLRSAEHGNKKACNYLFGIMTRNRNDNNFIDENTWEHIEELSDQGHSFADMLMHYKYYGMGTQNDIAIKYLKRAMEKKPTGYGFLQLGICYNWGLGVKLSDILALHYYEKAIELGCKEAYSYIGQKYRFGGEKVKKDLTKAESYLKKGIELGQSRCFSQLFSLYSDAEDPENAQKLAQQMIDTGIKGGYSLMGDYYYSILFSYDEARDWYKLAIKHDETQAWGSLAMVQANEGEYEEAYQSAQRGCLDNDSFSYVILGYLYERDGNYSMAWDYYRQRYLKFGTGAENLGELYLDGRQPQDGFNLQELKTWLEICAKGQSIEATRCLLRIILREHDLEDSALDYEHLKEIPESYDIIRIGAGQNDKDLAYIYGLLLIENQGKLHNPYSGLEYVELAAKNDNRDAMMYALKKFSNEHNQAKLKELSQIVIENNMAVEDYSITVLKSLETYNFKKLIEWLFDNNAFKYGYSSEWITCLKSAFKKMSTSASTIEDLNSGLDLLLNIIYKIHSPNPPLQLCLYNGYLMLEPNRENERINGVLDDIRGYFSTVNDTAMSLMYYHCIIENLDLVFPDYIPSIFSDDEASKDDSFIRFIVTSMSLDEGSLISHFPETGQEYETNVYNLIENDISKKYLLDLPADIDNDFLPTFYFINSYNSFVSQYHKFIPNEEGIKQDEYEIQRDPVFLYCSTDLIIHLLKNLYIMIHSLKEIYGDLWEEVQSSLNNFIALLNIVEDTSPNEEDIRLITLSFVDTCIYAFETISQNNRLRNACYHSNKEEIAQFLNDYVKNLEKRNIHHNFPHFNADNLPDSIFAS